MLGVVQGEVAEQQVDRGEPVVPGRGAVAPHAFQAVQEGTDGGGVQSVDGELAGRRPCPLDGERQQQPKRGAIGGDRVRAGGPLVDQPLGEVRLQSRASVAITALLPAVATVRRPVPSARGRRSDTSRCRADTPEVGGQHGDVFFFDADAFVHPADQGVDRKAVPEVVCAWMLRRGADAHHGGDLPQRLVDLRSIQGAAAAGQEERVGARQGTADRAAWRSGAAPRCQSDAAGRSEAGRTLRAGS